MKKIRMVMLIVIFVVALVSAIVGVCISEFGEEHREDADITINDNATTEEDINVHELDTTVVSETTTLEIGTEMTVPETTVPETEAATKAPETTKVPETTKAPETQNGWLGVGDREPVESTNSTPVTAAPETEKVDPEELLGTYDPYSGREVTVLFTREGVNGLGLKTITTVYSNGTSKTVAECRYCHEFPCPNGGDENCPEYDVAKDDTITCQQCGKPYGDGHNGTCYGEIDWENGGEVICHHYD